MPHFTDKEIEAQRKYLPKVTCLVKEPVFELGLPET